MLSTACHFTDVDNEKVSMKNSFYLLASNYFL